MKILLFFILVFLSSLSFGQEKNKIISKKIDSIYKKSGFPGFAVAVVNENGIVFENSYGFANLKSKEKYTVNSIQNIGSASKTFIGIALMKAIELGYFDLETDINTILPFTVSNPNIENGIIRIKDLATHTSGILDNEKVYIKSFYENNYSNKKSRLYKAFIKRNTIPNRDDLALGYFLKNYLDQNGKWFSKDNFNTSKAGLEYNYSNIGAALAAHLIEIKSKMNYEDFCKIYIFEPLKLNETSFLLNDSSVAKHVKLYNGKQQNYPLYSEITYPDGGLKTSCHQLSIYLQEMIKGYEGKSNLLTQKSFELLFKKQFKDEYLPLNYDKREPNSGIFWRIKKDGTIGHSGSDLGITTFMFFDPKTKIGKIFMTNIEFDNPDNDSINEKLVKQFISIWKTLDSI